MSFLVSLQIENAKEQAFAEAYGRLVTDSRALTQSYQTEIGKWKSRQFNNGTMISITDQYLPKSQKLIDRAKELQSTGKYSKSRDFSIQSFQSELESYRHFRSFLVTLDRVEDAMSTQLLSDAKI